jgi:hypothetical protein
MRENWNPDSPPFALMFFPIVGFPAALRYFHHWSKLLSKNHAETLHARMLCLCIAFATICVTLIAIGKLLHDQLGVGKGASNKAGLYFKALFVYSVYVALGM